MIQPASLEELASLVEKDGKKVFLFVADWCGDCRYIYPALPEIEESNPELPLFEWTETSIWIWLNSGMFTGFLALKKKNCSRKGQGNRSFCQSRP